MAEIAENIREVQNKIAIAARKTGRDLHEITLIAVSKNIPVERIKQAIAAGIDNIGENRVQEAREKIPQITGNVTWHMIGHLQKNKVKYAVELFDYIQSIDSFELADLLNRRCIKANRRMPVLVEVNTSGEETKYGCKPAEAIPLLKNISVLENIEVRGFMTIGLFSDNPEEVRPCFTRLKRIYEQARQLEIPGSKISMLSMGMSADFEIAIEEGSNLVRIGTAIFGPREN